MKEMCPHLFHQCRREPLLFFQSVVDDIGFRSRDKIDVDYDGDLAEGAPDEMSRIAWYGMTCRGIELRVSRF